MANDYGDKSDHEIIVELERRENKRGDRQIGFAKWQHGFVHEFCPYDFEINTELKSPEENAEKLKALFYSDSQPTAFKCYRQTLKVG